MKNIKKAVALFLAALVVASCFSVSAFAGSVDPNNGTGDKIKSYLYMGLDKVVSTAVSVLNRVIPGIDFFNDFPDIEGYTPKSFYPGEEKFDTEVGDGAKWKVGYASDSLIKDLEYKNGVYLYKGKKVYMAGSLEVFKGRQPTEIVDDQQVRTYAITDSVGGTVVHAVVDGYGLASGDVAKIRARLEDFAKKNNIVSINVSVLHQHSCIDTLGMAAPLFPALLVNPILSVFGIGTNKYIGGRTPEFMENLYSVVADTAVKAVESMKEGTLYYGSIDSSEYMFDKREPKVIDPEIHRFRFVPDDETENEIWICEAGIHAVGAGISTSKLCGDFPYYLRESVKKANKADVVFVQGAELAITGDYELLEFDNEVAGARPKALGEALAKKLLSISNDEKLAPVLNIAHQNVYIRLDNQILELAIREGLVGSTLAKDKDGYIAISEIGYMELGNKIGIMIVPGEISPELLWGGVIEKDKTWIGKSWDYPPFEETAKTEKLLCFGLANDQIGYIIPDNDYRSMFTENEEILAGSTTSASTIARAFAELIKKVKKDF